MEPAFDLEKCYANRFSDQADQRQRVWQVLVRYFQQWIGPEDTVLDLGAGYCEFINNVRAKQRYALDLNPTTKTAAHPDVSVISHDVTLPWPMADRSVNVVFSSNFLEHLPDKPAVLHCLREAHRVLVPDGKIILLGPNIRFCSEVYWDFFDHYVPLSDRSIVEALELAQFDVVKVVDRFLPFTMRSSLPTHPVLVWLYLQLPIAWKILGSQFVVVGLAKTTLPQR